MLFTVPSSKQPLPSGAKQATYTIHSWDFRPCHRRPPLCPCWEPKNGRARSTRAGDQRAGRSSVTDPARHPHSGPGPGVRECRAGPGRPSVTDPARHPPRWATDRLGVSGQVRSVRTRVTSGSVTAVGGAGPGSVALLWWTQPGTPHGKRLTIRECQAEPGQPDGPELRHKQM
jgi:hypothetical protein